MSKANDDPPQARRHCPTCRAVFRAHGAVSRAQRQPPGRNSRPSSSAPGPAARTRR